MTRPSFKSLQQEALEKGLNLIRYPNGGYSLESGKVKLYGSGYGQKLITIKIKLTKMVATVPGEPYLNNRGFYEEGWSVPYI